MWVLACEESKDLPLRERWTSWKLELVQAGPTSGSRRLKNDRHRTVRSRHGRLEIRVPRLERNCVTPTSGTVPGTVRESGTETPNSAHPRLTTGVGDAQRIAELERMRDDRSSTGDRAIDFKTAKVSCRVSCELSRVTG